MVLGAVGLLLVYRIVQSPLDFAWKLFQAVVIFLVIASNIYLGWAGSNYLAGLIGVCAAYSLTLGLSFVQDQIAIANAKRDMYKRSAKEQPAVD